MENNRNRESKNERGSGFEFRPFTRKNMISYLKNLMVQKNYLHERQETLFLQLQELTARKMVNGQSIEERARMYAYGSHNSDSEVQNGSHYNPDTLFNRWLKVYEPYERQRLSVIDHMRKVGYQQKQLECVNQCVEQLETRQRDIILHIYIRREKVQTYCRTLQLGHSSYNELKNQALDNLVQLCNEQLAYLQKKMEESNEKMDDDFQHMSFPNGNGWNL